MPSVGVLDAAFKIVRNTNREEKFVVQENCCRQWKWSLAIRTCFGRPVRMELYDRLTEEGRLNLLRPKAYDVFSGVLLRLVHRKEVKSKFAANPFWSKSAANRPQERVFKRYS